MSPSETKKYQFSASTICYPPAPTKQRSFLRQSRQTFRQEFVIAVGVAVSDIEDVPRPIGDAPVVGDAHPHGELAAGLDGDVDLAPLEQRRLQHEGGHA